MPRKVFTAGEVLAASDVNNFLMDQTVMTFAGTAARGSAIASPTEGMYTHLNDTDALQYYDGTNWVSAIPASGPAIVQVVTASTATMVTSTSTTFIDTGLTATITPTSADNKILVLISQPMAAQHNNSGNNASGEFVSLRGATEFGLQLFESNLAPGSGNVLTNAATYVLSALDSPNTTSATIYKTQLRRTGGTGFIAQYNSKLAPITLIEVSA